MKRICQSITRCTIEKCSILQTKWIIVWSRQTASCKEQKMSGRHKMNEERQTAIYTFKDLSDSTEVQIGKHEILLGGTQSQIGRKETKLGKN